jgi:hypothetical protein
VMNCGPIAKDGAISRNREAVGAPALGVVLQLTGAFLRSAEHGTKLTFERDGV